VNYKQTIASVLDASGDTIYSSVSNSGFEDLVTIVTTNQLTDSLKFLRTLKEPNVQKPIAFSISFKEKSAPIAKSTKVKGSELSFTEELQIYCQFYDASGDIWVSSSDLVSNSITSNEIIAVTSYGKQSIKMRYREELSYIAISDIESTDSLSVYRLSGEINSEFYKKDSPTQKAVFTVTYEALPLFIKN
jgi:hypothetical protein